MLVARRLAGFQLGVCSVLLASVSIAGEYRDTGLGFSLQPPAFVPGTKPGMIQPVIFSASPSDGFAPNCNVQVQNADLSIQRYEELTNQQFKSAGWVVSERISTAVSGKPALRWHYSGALRGKEFEWVAVVIAVPKRFYLMTCTALKEHFAENAAVFDNSLASFKVP
ncbi:MAG: hypothetical protein ABI411_12780 [Tahibacter sp.]